MGTTQIKTLNPLRTTMIKHNFEIQDQQKSNLPNCLKTRQTKVEQQDSDQDRTNTDVIHIDLINTNLNMMENSGQIILSITDDT